MKLIFLGTGTSVGVPAIGCGCPVCKSTDVRNKRRRTSVFVEAGGVNALIDTPPDLRDQALTFGVTRVDLIVFTHTHADHVFGFDDVRAFNVRGRALPVYGSPSSIADLRRIFPYAEGEAEPGRYKPCVEFLPLPEVIRTGALTIRPVEVVHHPIPTVGFRVECEGRTLGYFPDVSHFPDSAVEAVRGVDVMILDALRHRPHFAHFTVAQALEVLRRVGARSSYLIHMCHELDHAQTEAALPPGVRLAYDGLTLEW